MEKSNKKIKKNALVGQGFEIKKPKVAQISKVAQKKILEADFKIDSYVPIPPVTVKTSLTELYNGIGVKKISNLQYAGSYYDMRRNDYSDYRYFIFFDSKGKKIEIENNKITKHSLSFSSKFPPYEVGFNKDNEVISIHSKGYYLCYRKISKLYYIDLRKKERTWINAPLDIPNRLKIQPIVLSGVDKLGK